MQLPSQVLATRDRYLAAFPLWVMPPGPEAEERGRQWTLGLIAQINFDHPALAYGSKQSSPTNPPSKDAVAQIQPSGALYSWDMLSGVGTGAPTSNPNPDHHDITGQVYIEIAAADVIGGEVPLPEPTPPPSTAPGYDENKSIQFGLGCNEVYKESGAAVDPGMISVHSQRAAYDYYVGGLSWDESYRKHINEFRAVYGLPPV